MKNTAATSLLRLALLAVFVVAIAFPRTAAQENPSPTVRLFRLDGSLGTELPVKVNSEDNSENFGIKLRDARLEADSMRFFTRLRSVITISNTDTTRRIIEVEWRLDVYDEALRSLSQRVLQSEKLNIYSGETAKASARFGAVLPDRMIVLLQLVRVSFADGSSWRPRADCALGEDLRAVSCNSK